uniref:hypothetical protein n=1 Tax=Bacteroides gallinarum TaxID=376806 RepID=UPI003133B327
MKAFFLGQAGLSVYTAAGSQVLLRLQRGYCNRKECLYCRFGHECLRGESAPCGERL